MSDKIFFLSDYMEGAHPAIIEKLVETNLEHTPGYGTDLYTENAKEMIREACGCLNAEVKFLMGGTQTNATVIDAILRSYQGVIAANTGHINGHEAGAVEFCGHKVLALPNKMGKISAEQVEDIICAYNRDESREHTVMPGMVYISQPTEYGTIYSKHELEELSKVCRNAGITLFVDGARLAYALAAEENDVSLMDLAKLCDAFYIGGTKCGALFGEAVVIPNPDLIPHFFTLIKQHGALLAKGRLLGIQFATLFTDGLYERIGESAVSFANLIRKTLRENGYKLFIDSPTNQVFPIIEDEKLRRLSEHVAFEIWEKYDENHTVIRFVTSWATEEKDVAKLIKILESGI